MQTLSKSPTNQAKLAQVQAALDAMLREVLDHGFHGRAAIEVMVSDGTIQRVGRLVERIEK